MKRKSILLSSTPQFLPALVVCSILSCSVRVNLADDVYLTSIDGGNAHFARYDVDADSWTRLNDYDTTAQMAVSRTGGLYALNAATNVIQLYNPALDTWSDVLAGPQNAGSGRGNLEITNDGRFFLTQQNGSVVHYTDAAQNWQSLDLGIAHHAMGDYDPTTGQYVIGEHSSDNARLIDTDTLAVTEFLDGPAGNGETARFSSIVGGRYYFQYATLAIHSYDLSDNTQAAQSTGVTPVDPFYSASAADRGRNGIYMANLDGDVFDFFDLDTGMIVDLANYGVDIGNHSSLAYVRAIPEPTTQALVLAAACLQLKRRRKRAEIASIR